MSILSDLFKKKPKPKPISSKTTAIYRRLQRAVDQANAHEPTITMVILTESDRASLEKAGGRESKLFPRDLKDVRIEDGPRSALTLSDGSIVGF